MIGKVIEHCTHNHNRKHTSNYTTKCVCSSKRTAQVAGSRAITFMYNPEAGSQHTVAVGMPLLHPLRSCLQPWHKRGSIARGCKRMQEEKQNESTWFPVQSFSRSWYFETAVVVIPTTWTIYNHLDSPMSQVASDCMWKFTGNFEIGIRRLHLPENCKFSVPVQGLK